MTKIDLHTHTTASDGSMSPSELVNLAANSGFSALAVTDHDTVGGLAEADAASNAKEIKFIPGVEFSVNHAKGSLHLLGYGIDYNNPELNEVIKKLRNSRSDRNEKIIARLNELGYEITLDEVLNLAGEGTIGRGHIGKALVDHGYMATIQDTFDKLLTRGGPAYFERYRLMIEDAVDLIHRTGGIAVWAHPGLHERGIDAMLELLPGWIGAGLDGIESDYSQHTVELRDRIRKITLEYGIIYTGGSDFHGDLKPHIKLGDGPEGAAIDPRIVAAILDKIESSR